MVSKKKAPDTGVDCEDRKRIAPVNHRRCAAMREKKEECSSNPGLTYLIVGIEPVAMTVSDNEPNVLAVGIDFDGFQFPSTKLGTRVVVETNVATNKVSRLTIARFGAIGVHLQSMRVYKEKVKWGKKREESRGEERKMVDRLTLIL